MDESGRERWTVPDGLRQVGVASWYAIGVALTLVGVLLLLAVTRTIAIPLILGVLFGIAAFGMTDFFERHGLKRAWAALAVTFLAVAISAIVTFVVIDQIVGQAEVIGDNLSQAAQQLKDSASGSNGAADAVTSIQDGLKQNWQALLKGSLPVLGSAISNFATMCLIIFLAFNVFFLVQKDGRRLKRWAARRLLLPVPLGESILGDSVRAVRGYFIGNAIVGLENALVLWAAAMILGTPVPFVIAVVAFLFAFVPFIGAIVSGAFAVLMALAGGGTTDALIMLAFVILSNGILQTIVQQWAMGAALKLHPLVILVATMTGSIIAGPIGGMISAPLAAVMVMATGRLREAGMVGVAVAHDDGRATPDSSVESGVGVGTPSG